MCLPAQLTRAQLPGSWLVASYTGAAKGFNNKLGVGSRGVALLYAAKLGVRGAVTVAIFWQRQGPPLLMRTRQCNGARWRRGW